METPTGVRYWNGAWPIWREHGTTTPGRDYSGPLVEEGKDFFVMASEGDVLVGHPQDLPEGCGRHATVQATPFPSTSEDPKIRLDRDLDY